MTKTVLKYIGYFFSAILILYVLIMIFIPERSMDVFGFRTFVVVSTSMEPDINKYDMIVIKKANEDTLEVRDAITFFVYIPEVSQKSYVTHYIGAIETDGSGEIIYKTQGASKAPGDYDDWTDGSGNPVDISMDDIEGEYVFRIPWIGYLMIVFRDPIFVILLVLNGTIIYGVYRYIRHILSENKDKTEPNEKETE